MVYLTGTLKMNNGVRLTNFDHFPSKSDKSMSAEVCWLFEWSGCKVCELVLIYSTHIIHMNHECKVGCLFTTERYWPKLTQ